MGARGWRYGWAAALVVVGLSACSQSASIGAICTNDSDCQRGLVCHHGGDYDGQCTAACDTCEQCEEIYGSSEAACLGLGICVLYCGTGDPTHVRTSCPAGTTCDSYGWCER